ncbi:MAG TPA: hypothetical protein VN750_12470 [Steroidobacteraceae bacterium]|nr:hypothetical protein [Steroidobacteraceae bacterium]
MSYGNSAFASSSGGGGSVSLVVPDNAKLFAWAMDTIGSPGETFAFPSGFTALTPIVLNAGNNASVASLQLAWKDASSEPGSYSITWSHSGQPGMYGVFYFTGRASGAGAITYQDTQGPAGTSSGSPVSAPLTGLTAPSGADIVWLPALCIAGAGTPVWTPPTGYTVHGSLLEATDARAIALASKDGGGTGAATGTLTGSVSGTGGDTMGIVLALAAAAGGGNVAAIRASMNAGMSGGGMGGGFRG